MRQPTALFLLASVLVTGLVACNRASNRAKLEADFAHICVAQRDFLSARKLKGVDEAELLVERIRRMREGLSSAEAIRVADSLTQPSDAAQRLAAEKAAEEAGLKGWACPELAYVEKVRAKE